MRLSLLEITILVHMGWVEDKSARKCTKIGISNSFKRTKIGIFHVITFFEAKMSLNSVNDKWLANALRLGSHADCDQRSKSLGFHKNNLKVVHRIDGIELPKIWIEMFPM